VFNFPAIIVEAERLSVLVLDESGNPVAKDPGTEKVRTIDWDTRQLVISFASRETSPAAAEPGSWLWETMNRFHPENGQLLALTAIINCSVIALSFAVMNIFDTVIPADAFDTLAGVFFGVMVLVGLELFFRYTKSRLVGRVSGRIEYLLGTAIFSKLISLPAPMLINTPIGDQISRLRQFETLRDLFSGPFVAIALEVPFILMFILVLFMLGGMLGFVPLALGLFYLAAGLLLVGPVRRQTKEAARLKREQYQSTLETVTNLRHIHALGCEDVWLERLQQKIIHAARAKRHSNLGQRLLGRIAAIGVPVAGCATAVIGALMVMDNELTTGALIAAMILMWRVLAPIQQLFLTMTHVSDMVETATQIDRMMRLRSVETTANYRSSKALEGQIEFHRVSFRYQNSPFMTLQGLAFAIQPGEFIAIEGASGSGKTTILRLILDLQRQQTGNIVIDGTNIRQIPYADLRASIGYVPQKPSLFHGTIAQNLRLAAPGATDAAIEDICAELGLSDAIAQMPKGIDTLLDHARKEQMSNGFKQAFSIAQALLAEPKILLLDEPAKSLDPALDEAFLKAIERRRGKMTILMVSHRPSHIRLADKVLTLDSGQVVSFQPPRTSEAA